MYFGNLILLILNLLLESRFVSKMPLPFRTMRDIKKGIVDSLLTLPSFLFVGIIFGIYGMKQGLGLAKTVFMSIVMFHGAAQFVALNLMAENAETVAILIAVLFINIRFLICSTGLALHLKDLSLGKTLLISSMVTTPTFAIAVNRFLKEGGNWHYLLGLHLISYLTWVAATLIGAMVEMKIPLFLQEGMRFAFYALLIGILSIGFKRVRSLVNIISCAVISIFIYYLTKTTINIVVAPLIASTAMVLGEQWKRKLLD
jgi:4-azaleucine resistance transporter AzlC